MSPVVINNLGYHLRKVYDPNVTKFVKVPCGRCANCLSRKVDEWVMRLSLEMYDESATAKFVTLTYNDENLPSDGVCKRDVQLYHKRIRKALGNDFLYKFRYVLISEYGAKFHRPHYHAIYYNCPDYVLEDCWQKGFVDIKDILPERLAYICSYHVLKNYFVPNGQNENFRFSSKFLGLENFLFYEYENAKKNDFRFLIDSEGCPHVLSRYFRKKFDIKFETPQVTLVDKVVQDKIDIQNFITQAKIATDLYIKRKMLFKQI